MGSSLVACPFCRELYDAAEAENCPVCGVVLKPLHDLPPSFETREQEALDWERTPPEDRALPWWRMDNGKGLLLAASVVGLAFFFAPWIVLTQPETATLSGFQLAATRGFWFGGGAVAWFINLPLVLSRRTVNQMRGVRVVCTLFASMTACQALMLRALAPTDALVPVDYHWGWGFYGSAAVSVLGVVAAVGFGAKRPVFPEAPQGSGERPNKKTETPTQPPSETLH